VEEKMLIKNGWVIDPKNHIDGIMDIYIEDGKIKELGNHLTYDDEQIIDAKGCWVIPGAVDMHVHLREPGYEYKETIESGSKSAAKGGVTTICAMPNTNPCVDSKEMVERVYRIAQKKAVVHVLQVGAITKGQEGKELADIKGMKEAGICAISEDGRTVMNSGLLKEAMKVAKELNIPVLSHCEDENLSGGAMNEGKVSKRLGIPGIPREAEDIITGRDIQLAKGVGGKIHICHVSTKESAKLIRYYKEEGIQVTGEVCPHHFTLTDSSIDGTDANYKMAPPLREKEDVVYLKRAIEDNTIDVLATDHAPHHKDEKEKSFVQAPNGIIGLETLIPLTITELVEKGYLTKVEMVKKLCLNPATILGIDKGHLSPGVLADIAVISPNESYILTEEMIVSKSKNSPFIGRTLKGLVKYTLVDGKVVYKADSDESVKATV